MTASRKNKGFSLVEVVVVIAIVGIMAAIAYPNLMQSIRNSKTRAVASDIFSSFRSARIEAVKRNTSVCLDFKTTGTYEAFLGDDLTIDKTVTPQICKKDGTVSTLFTKQVEPGTTITADFSAGYNTQGRPLAGTLGNVTVQNDSNPNLQYKSALSIAGRVDLQVSQDGGAHWQ